MTNRILFGQKLKIPLLYILYEVTKRCVEQNEDVYKKKKMKIKRGVNLEEQSPRLQPQIIAGQSKVQEKRRICPGKQDNKYSDDAFQ